MQKSFGMNGKALLLLCIILGMLSMTCGFSAAEEQEEMILELAEITEIGKGETSIAGDPAEGYILKKMYPKKQGMLRVQRPSGSRLEGAEGYLYRQLLPLITDVAAGKRGEAVFQFRADEIYEKTVYTAEELGVESILITSNGTTGFRRGAVDAINRIVTGAFNQKKILNCLMADCPYEMYWYDKTVGNLLQYPEVVKGENENGEDTLEITGTVTFNMAVSLEYRNSSKEPRIFTINGQNVERYCDVDTAWGSSVSLAAGNAREIVDRYEDCEDYDRLTAYKNEIKDLTGYNIEAADSENEVPYGNPWQLVWVFDGNPETKVVCEGFSKAFQYLNDLSASEVTVICATGTMDEGPHMWNIVRMEDGCNYLADITNCYTDGNGNEYLFLTGGAHLEDGADGYSFAFGDGYANYIYDEEQYGDREAEELTIAGVGYLAAKPPVPAFAAGEDKDTFQIGTPLTFAYQENPEQSYDSFVAKVTYISPDNTERVFRESFTLSGEETSWEFGPQYHMAGTYRVQFAGKSGAFTSLWSDAVELQPGYISDLGRIGLTEDTRTALTGIYAGDEGQLEWITAENGLNGIMVRLTEKDGTILYEKTFEPEEYSTAFLWTFCPGNYVLSFLPDVDPGYAYDTDDPVTVNVLYSGKAWRLEDGGRLVKYFGSSESPAVPEELDGIPVETIGAGTFEKTKAAEVTVPSVIRVETDAFSGSGIQKIYGYERSDAESVAQEAGIQFVSLGVKPGVPVCRVSSEKGYTGYSLVIRLEEEVDAVRIRETGETVLCDGPDVLIPLTVTGDSVQYTFSAIKDGVRGDYGEPVTVCIREAGASVLSIPDHIREVEEEAFRNIRVSKIVIPDSVLTVGAYAFAGNPDLQIVEIANPGILNDTALDQCDGAVFCFETADDGFDSGKPFVVCR